jgi:hypothetical protein
MSDPIPIERIRARAQGLPFAAPEVLQERGVETAQLLLFLLAQYDALAAVLSSARLAAEAAMEDLRALATLCGIRDDEYPRKAIERRLADLRQALERIRDEGGSGAAVRMSTIARWALEGKGLSE